MVHVKCTLSHTQDTSQHAVHYLVTDINNKGTHNLNKFTVWVRRGVPGSYWQMCLVLINKVSLETARVTKFSESCTLITLAVWKASKNSNILHSWHVIHTRTVLIYPLSLHHTHIHTQSLLCSWELSSEVWTAEQDVPGLHYLVIWSCAYILVLQRAGSSKWAWLCMLLLTQPNRPIREMLAGLSAG